MPGRCPDKAARVAAALLATASLAACSHSAPETRAPSGPGARDPVASFAVVRAVMQSPRCMNCHPAGDAPLQGDDSHVHTQHIVRGTSGFGAKGISCSACHGEENLPESYGPHAPPGLERWRLPPPGGRLVFQGVSPRALCEQIKDPARNGDKDAAELVEHVSQNPLVLWGWSPGYGRKPVPVPHAEFVAAFRDWAEHGMPCPPD